MTNYLILMLKIDNTVYLLQDKQEESRRSHKGNSIKLTLLVHIIKCNKCENMGQSYQRRHQKMSKINRSRINRDDFLASNFRRPHKHQNGSNRVTYAFSWRTMQKLKQSLVPAPHSLMYLNAQLSCGGN